MSKKKKKEDEFNNATIANMNVEGFAWHQDYQEEKRVNDYQKIQLTKKEKRAIIKAAFLNLLPTFICIACGFTITMLLIFLWLH